MMSSTTEKCRGNSKDDSNESPRRATASSSFASQTDGEQHLKTRHHQEKNGTELIRLACESIH